MYSKTRGHIYVKNIAIIIIIIVLKCNCTKRKACAPWLRQREQILIINTLCYRACADQQSER
jgi:hypothetical protein